MRTIDTHAHIVPQDCLELLPEPLAQDIMVGDMTDIDVRLKEMDESGIEVQALSGYLALLNKDVATARQFNDSLARVVAAHPDRFVGLALAPMAEPEKAPEELDRAVNELGMVGVGIASNINGTNLDAKELGPFYAKVQELDIPIFIHPANVLGPDRLADWYLSNFIGNVTDTAVAAASIIFGGVFQEFPRLKIYLAHGGGSCPYIRGRWDHGWANHETGSNITNPPSEYMRLFYFDALTHSSQTLQYLVESFGHDKVMLGSDYPFDMGDIDQVSHISEANFLTNAQKEDVMGLTAAKLFKI